MLYYEPTEETRMGIKRVQMAKDVRVRMERPRRAAPVRGRADLFQPPLRHAAPELHRVHLLVAGHFDPIQHRAAAGVLCSSYRAELTAISGARAA